MFYSNCHPAYESNLRICIFLFIKERLSQGRSTFFLHSFSSSKSKFICVFVLYAKQSQRVEETSKEKKPEFTPYLALERRSTTEKHTKYTNITLQIRFHPIPSKGTVSVPLESGWEEKTSHTELSFSSKLFIYFFTLQNCSCSEEFIMFQTLAK